MASLTATQRLWNLLNEAVYEASDNAARYEADAPDKSAWYAGRHAGLTTAIRLLRNIDPEADTGEPVPGRVYGPEVA
jgi:hypothetical protein